MKICLLKQWACAIGVVSLAFYSQIVTAADQLPKVVAETTKLGACFIQVSRDPQAPQKVTIHATLLDDQFYIEWDEKNRSGKCATSPTKKTSAVVTQQFDHPNASLTFQCGGMLSQGDEKVTIRLSPEGKILDTRQEKRWFDFGPRNSHFECGTSDIQTMRQLIEMLDGLTRHLDNGSKPVNSAASSEILPKAQDAAEFSQMPGGGEGPDGSKTRTRPIN